MPTWARIWILCTGLVCFVALYAVANVIKYMWRWKEKGGADDLKKARWYLDYLIKEVEKPHVR